MLMNIIVLSKHVSSGQHKKKQLLFTNLNLFMNKKPFENIPYKHSSLSENWTMTLVNLKKFF